MYYIDNRGQNNLNALTVHMTHAPVAIQRVKHELRSTRLHIHRGIPMKRATKIYCQRLPNISIFTSNVYFVNLQAMTWPREIVVPITNCIALFALVYIGMDLNSKSPSYQDTAIICSPNPNLTPNSHVENIIPMLYEELSLRNSLMVVTTTRTIRRYLYYTFDKLIVYYLYRCFIYIGM